MTNDNNIKRIIQLYFGKHFSRSGRVLFGRWLRAEGGASEKSDMLQAFWEHLPAEATAETREDWDALQRHLQVEPVRRNTVPMYRGWIKYAAVIALMLLTGAATFFVTDRLQPVRHVEMAELFVPYGESRQVILPDGSQVWVDAGSLLVYPKDFTDTETRTVYLTGEASFTVRKNTEKPFIVKTTYLDVQALGTVFTVASYPADSCTSTILEEGSVKVDVRAGEHQPAILKPNERLVYSHAAHTVTVRPVDALLYKMERSGYLIYENVSFSHLMASLERKFNVTIHYNSQKYADEYYNVKFAPHETLEDVLAVLQQLIGIRFKIKGNVGFFIVTMDFIGYTGTVLVLMFKEFAHADINWLEFYNILSGYVGLICTVAFTCSMIYLIQRYKKEKQLKKAKEAEMSNGIKFTGEGMEPTTFSQI